MKFFLSPGFQIESAYGVHQTLTAHLMYHAPLRLIAFGTVFGPHGLAGQTEQKAKCVEETEAESFHKPYIPAIGASQHVDFACRAPCG